MAADPRVSWAADRLAEWARGFASAHELASAEVRIDPPLHADEADGLRLAMAMNLVTITSTGEFHVAGAKAGKGPYNLFSRGRAPALNREYLAQIAVFAELVLRHGWPAQRVVFGYEAFDLAVVDDTGRLPVTVEAKKDQQALETTLAKMATATPAELSAPATTDHRKAAGLVRLRPSVFGAVAPGVRRWFTVCADAGLPRLVPCDQPPSGPRDDVDCLVCGGADVHGNRVAGDRIGLSCGACGHRWSRTPRHPCPRCGSGDVEQGGYTG